MPSNQTKPIDKVNATIPFRETGLHGVVANMLNCDIVVNEFEFQLRCHVPFRTKLWIK